jgi:hypothetical protein
MIDPLILTVNRPSRNKAGCRGTKSREVGKFYLRCKVLKWAMVFWPYSPSDGRCWKRVDFLHIIRGLFPGYDKYSGPFVCNHEIALKEPRICGLNLWPRQTFLDWCLSRIFTISFDNWMKTSRTRMTTRWKWNIASKSRVIGDFDSFTLTHLMSLWLDWVVDNDRHLPLF